MNSHQRRTRRRAHERFIANMRRVQKLWYAKDEADRRLYGMMDAMRTGRNA
ncbi:hypothetical protein K0U83_07070 [bacterium]|nr:hypothetical protein [bacterium]